MMVNFMSIVYSRISEYYIPKYLSIFHGYSVINYLIQLDSDFMDIAGYLNSETLYTHSFFLVYPGNMQTTAFIPLYP